MISRTFRAALLMLKTSAGYFPVPVSKCLSGRMAFCAEPFTRNVLVCSGYDVGMPLLRWCVCHVATGKYGTPPTVDVEFHGVVRVYDGLELPVCVSYKPSMCGLSHVWLSGSTAFFGKSHDRSDFAEPDPS